MSKTSMASELPDAPAEPGRRDWAIIVSLLALAASVRLYRLDQGFWYDEIWALAFFRGSWLELATSMPLPNHHPLYSFLAKICVELLGEHEWSARLPALVPGVLAPPALYLMSARLANRRVGLIAGTSLAAAVAPVWFSQDARGYSLVIFLSIAATWLFSSLYRRPSRAKALAYAAVAAAAIYTHLFAGALFGAHLLIALCFLSRKRSRRAGLWLAGTCLAGLVLALLLWAPLLPDLYDYAASAGRRTEGRSLSPRFIVGLFLSWSSGEDHPILSALVIVAAAAGVAVQAKSKPVLAASLALSLAIGFAVPALLGTFVYKRFFCYAIPGFYLAAAMALDLLATRLRRPGAAAWALALAMLFLAGRDLPAYYKQGKQGIRPAAEWIDENAPETRVLTLGMIGEVFGYYCPRAVMVPRGARLRASDLRNATVVYSYPETAGAANIDLVLNRCGPPVVFPAHGDENAAVFVHVCR